MIQDQKTKSYLAWKNALTPDQLIWIHESMLKLIFEEMWQDETEDEDDK